LNRTLRSSFSRSLARFCRRLSSQLALDIGVCGDGRPSGGGGVAPLLALPEQASAVFPHARPVIATVMQVGSRCKK
jgi:hypothetical protein